MTMTATATIDDLVAAACELDEERLDVLLHHVNEQAMEENNNTTVDPDQLDLFGFKHMVETDDELKTVTLKDITAVYGISNRTLLRHIQDGKLKAVRFGRSFRITVANLKAYLNK